MPLAVCATPIGNLDDVTLRVLEELRACDLVLCEDTRRTKILLDRHGIERSPREPPPAQRGVANPPRTRAPARRRAGGARVGCGPSRRQRSRRPADRGGAADGLPVTVLPGASAVETALVASGLAADQLPVRGLPPAAGGGAARRCRRRSPPGPAPSSRSSLPAASPGRCACSRRSSRAARGRLPRADEALRGGRPRARSTSSPAASPSRRAVRSRSSSGRPTAPAISSSDDAARAAMAELVEAGASRRTAAEVVSRLTGASRNALYRGSL